MNPKRKIALIHRYGLEGWICCGGHAVPGMIDRLAEECEIHFHGPRSAEPKNPALRARLRMHELPFRYDRANPRDKITKTLLWYLFLPLVALRCRLAGIQLIWNDETVPLVAPVLRLFFGRKIAITVMDFFMRIYTENRPRLHRIRDLVERIDLAAWRKADLLFTKVEYTQTVLAARGVPKDLMRLYRNPVDHEKFHPIDEATRRATRERFGFSDADLVLTHHGILHPNKGNDWLLRRLAEFRVPDPGVRVPLPKLLLVGNGPEMPHLKRLAEELGIADRVVFAGWLPSERELNDALASADVGLVMRIGQETDHFHMTDTLAHEMACAKPILAVDLRGIAEVVDGRTNGFLFSPDDPGGFLEKLRLLASDVDLRRRFGEAALQTARNECDVDRCAARLTKTLLSALGSAQPSKIPN